MTTAGDDEHYRWLFVKERFAWPRSSGHDVHTYGMMKALIALGHEVSVCTVDPPPDAALDGLSLERRYCLSEANPPVPTAAAMPLILTHHQEKFRNYWGIPAERIRQVAAAADECFANVVVASGLNVLPYLGAVTGRTRVWYAADEWVWHHLSLVKPFGRSTWSELKPAVVKGLYERAYRSLLDRVWVVTESDARAFRWFAGISQTDVLPNGVDTEFYQPVTVPQIQNSCVFWGRLDFEPNVQALQWFVRKVWPKVRRQVPDARFRIFGFQPTPPVVALTGRDGIDLTGNVPDVRPLVRECQVVVLPFVSGGGIKNKLLEAAALGMPIIGTPRAGLGLNGTPPIVQTTRPAEFTRELVRLWSDPAERTKRGAAVREWVVRSHTWEAVARAAAEGLRSVIEVRE